MVSLTLKVIILHVAESDSKYRDVAPLRTSMMTYVPLSSFPVSYLSFLVLYFPFLVPRSLFLASRSSLLVACSSFPVRSFSFFVPSSPFPVSRLVPSLILLTVAKEELFLIILFKN